MSKASAYASACGVAESLKETLQIARPLIGGGHDQVLYASVNDRGRLSLVCKDRTLEVAEALRLRDWLTDTFDEVPPAPGATGSEGGQDG